MKHTHRHTPKIPLRDRIDPATLDITEIIASACICTFAMRVRMPQVLAVMPIVWGIAWSLRYDEESPRSPAADAAARHGAVELQQVGSLSGEEFEQLVRDAVDDLPDFVLRELEAKNIGVTISDAGHQFGAYGLCVGGSLAYDDWASQFLIFRDTLTRDFGADRDEPRDQVIRVVRHEVAHHLGAGERHVRDLGL